MLHEDFIEQVVYDRRSSETKAMREKFNREQSFKKDLDIWEDKPRIAHSELVKDQELANSIVHLVENRIVHIINTS